MAINKKLIHFSSEANFEKEKAAGNLLDTSIVFVADDGVGKKIYTHGEEYLTPDVSDLLKSLKLGDNMSMAEDSTISGKPIIEITYSELVDLKTNSNLIPGLQYRITDYVTTTSTENTQSAGNAFDLIVIADDENTLNCKARAINHTTKSVITTQRFDTDDGDFVDIYYIRYADGDTLLSDVQYYAWKLVDGTAIVYTKSETFSTTITCYAINGTKATGAPFKLGNYTETSETDYFSDCDLSKWEIWYDINNDTDKYVWADTTSGTGVIYRMIDEWRNDCPYDFKNIQFQRKTTNGVLDTDEGTTQFVYTFNLYDQQESIQYDASVALFTILNDEQGYSHTYGNVIGYYGESTNGTNNSYGYPHKLNDIVFLNIRMDGDFYYGCYSNVFGDSCYSITFGDNCYLNVFSHYCNNLSIGSYTIQDTFGQGCYDITIGEGSSYSTLGTNCKHIIIEDSYSNNIIGNSCDNVTVSGSNNKIGNTCRYMTVNGSNNTIGNNCYGSATIKFSCTGSNNSFGNNCYYIVCSGSNNEVGSYCYGGTNNTAVAATSTVFTINGSSNKIGNGCYMCWIGANSNVLGASCYYVNLLGSYNTLGGACRGSAYNNKLYISGTGNVMGSNCFGGTTSSYFYVGGNYNTFGNNCYLIYLGNGCNYNRFGTDCKYISLGTSSTYNICEDGVNYINNGKNSISGLSRNYFGPGCSAITLGSNCNCNKFEGNNYNIFLGTQCGFNTFKYRSLFIYFGSSTTSYKGYYQNIIIDECNVKIILNANFSLGTTSYLRNVHIHQGVNEFNGFGTVNTAANALTDNNSVTDTNNIKTITIPIAYKNNRTILNIIPQNAQDITVAPATTSISIS